MKINNGGVLLAFVLICFSGVLARAQAPVSVAGATLFQTASSNTTAPFDYPNYGVVFVANTGNTFTSGGVMDGSVTNPGSGTYSYVSSNADAFFMLTNHVGSFTGSYIFSNLASGSFVLNQASSGGYQNGTFSLYNGQALGSLVGLSIYCEGSDGANEGVESFPSFSALGFSANLVTTSGGVGDATVLYSYTLINHSTAKIVLNNQQNFVIYLFFNGPNTGGFTQNNPFGGWTVGTFVIPDTTPPAVRITNSPAGLLVSNMNYVVAGTAIDNVAVSNVLYSLNGGAWTPASPVNTFSNWTASITLIPGTNTLSVYSVDTSGNNSATASTVLDYVVTTPLTVITNGIGGINPSLNGQKLQVGKNYTLTATPAAGSGFTFTNWTYGFGEEGYSVLANKAALTFMMTSNLVLAANFADTAPPVLKITNVVNGMLVSNPDFTVLGTATDNVGVLLVQCQMNGLGFSDADASFDDSPDWSSDDYTLSPGTNVFQAYAVDTSGNDSPLISVNIVYVQSAPLTVSTNGVGSINPVDNGALLQIGKNYTLTAAAIAGTGFAFTNWTDDDDDVLSIKPALTFQMEPELSLVANFVDVAPPVLKITNTVNELQVSNAAYTVLGTATDNVGVASIYCQLNDTGWSNATSLIGHNWSDALTLNPGTNVFQAYATDGSGNISATSTVDIVYVLSATLTVSTNGVGSINPKDNGALLRIGQNYTLTASAVAGTGFAFTNWTGGVGLLQSELTDKAAYTFMMVTNLSLVANFVDVEAPVLKITNVVGRLEVSNAAFTVLGTATDNVGVADVYCQLNDTGWSNATSFVGRNWSDTLTLNPGTNVFQAYATDPSGNLSATSTVAIFYVVTAPLTVSTNGVGSINPKDNGALLRIGQNYTLTASAVAGTGFAFTNWTGTPLGILTNKATLQFTMVTNLSLTANFVDVEAPVLKITNTVNELQVSNAAYTVLGTATDNVSVADVYCQLNGGGFAGATSFVGHNWTDSVTLNPGTNVFQAYATDGSGNISATSTVDIVYVLSATLTVSTNGVGSISPKDNGALLRIGQNYTLTASAVAGTGFAFTNWTGTPLGILTNKATLQFTMVTNLSLTANFVDVEAPVLKVTNTVNELVISNTSSAYTVLGTATDNVSVAYVYYQLNAGGFTPVTSLSGRDWSQEVALNPGTNVFQAYAVDPSGNYSATNTVNIIYRTIDWAPATLNGLLAAVTPSGQSTLHVGFGASTFSQYASDTNESVCVGNYVYTKLGTNTAELRLTNTASPFFTNETPTDAYLTFTSTNTCVFTNADNSDTGSIVVTAQTNLVPATLSGLKVLFVDFEGGATHISLGGNSIVITNSDGTVRSGTYTAKSYSPVGEMLLVNQNSKLSYVQLNFTAASHGTYFISSYDSSGDLSDYDYGVFTVLTTAPGGNAPASLAGLSGIVWDAGIVNYLSFSNATFMKLALNTNEDNGVGTYTYDTTGANAAQLSLTYLAPPNETGPGGTADLDFVAPDFCIFTNQNNGGYLVAISFAPAQVTVPGTIAETTVTATSAEGVVDVITYNEDGTFTQVESNSGNPGTSYGTYVYTPYSPEGALVQLTYTDGGVVPAGYSSYVQVAVVPGEGNNFYFITSFDNTSTLINLDYGFYTTQ